MQIELTAEQETKLRKAFAAWRPVAAEKPQTPDRTGQWFVDVGDPYWQVEVTRSPNEREEHVCTVWLNGQSLSENYNWPETCPTNVSRYLRIPPKPDGADAIECRQPTDRDKFYNLSSEIVTVERYTTVQHHPDYGPRRWIKHQTDRKPWPQSISWYKDRSSTGGRWLLNTGGRSLGVYDTTEDSRSMIALALNMLPKCAAAMREDVIVNPACEGDGLERRHRRDATLADIDRAGFEL